MFAQRAEIMAFAKPRHEAVSMKTVGAFGDGVVGSVAYAVLTDCTNWSLHLMFNSKLYLKKKIILFFF